MQIVTNDLKEAVKNRLAQDKGLQVFQYYGFEPNNRKPQRENPFRQERTSSFFVNWYSNAFRFKDFGDTDIKGNAWDFVKRYHNLTDSADVWQVLADIYGVWGIESETIGGKRKTDYPKLQNSKHTTQQNDKVTLISITFRDFSPEELDFWWKKGEIDLPTLQAENVKVVQSFELAYPQSVGKAKIWKKDNLQFIFAFEIIAGKAYKLYQPKEQYRAFGKGKTSFLPNLVPAKEAFGENYRYTLGLDTLEVSSSAILCGGEADYLALKAKGYNAFTMGSEEAKIPPFVLEKLQTKNIEPKRLQVLYDTDFTGYKHSQLLKKQHKATILTLPKLQVQKNKTLPKPVENDLCDYVGEFGWDSELELCLSRKPFAKRGFVLHAVPQFKVQKYLKSFAGHISCFFLQHPKIQLVGDAGLGKTHTLLREVAPLMPNPVLFLVPYSIQVSQIEKEYADLGHELTCFHNKPNQEGEELRFAQVNVCTYDRAKHLFDKNTNFEIWIDESHLLTQAYPYRKEAIDNIMAMAEKASRVVLLSATPDYQFIRKEDYQPIVFQRAINPTFEIIPKNYSGKNEKEAILGELIATKEVKDQIVVIRLNDKKLALSCRNALVKAGYYQQHEIDFIFSMEEKNFYTRTHQSVVEKGLIPEGIKLLFVSSCFDCGINIYNTNVAHLILFETQPHDNQVDIAVQASQRFRSLEKLKITIVKPERKNVLPDALQATFKRERQAQALAEMQLQNILLAHNQYQQKIQRLLRKTTKTSYFKLNSDLSRAYQVLAWNKNANTFEINRSYLRCVVQTFLQENLGQEEYYQLLLKELPNARRRVGEKEENEPNKFIVLLKEAKEERKNWERETVERLLPQFEEAHQKIFFESLYAQSKDIHTKEYILNQTSASLHDIREQQKITPLLVSTHIEGAMETGLKHKLARKYFQLKDLLFTQNQIQTLLKEQYKEHDFWAMLKDVGNHIKLTACERLGEEVWLLAQDTITREEMRVLQFLKNELSKLPQTTPKEQKKTVLYSQRAREISKQIKILEGDKKTLEGKLYTIATQIKTKTAQQTLIRKIQTKEKQLHKAQQQQAKAEAQQQASRIYAWELNELSAYLNALQGKAHQQQMRVNLRLVESLCHTHTFRKKTWDEATQAYETKQYITINGLKTFEDVLEGYGLPTHEIQSYLRKLTHQMTTDVQQIRQDTQMPFLSKTTGKVHEASIVYYLHPKNIALNENGYPVEWD